MADTKPVRWRVLLPALMAAAVIASFLPALDVYIAGDDFEWLDASYDIVGDPSSSLELINHFFRPLVKWTYLGDYLIFGQIGVGYVTTNLLIHFLNSLLLYVLLERRLLQPVAAAAAAAFTLSPLHSEAVLWAAGRPDTVLLACWLGALLLLDRWCERPSAGRAVAFTCVTLLGIGAKESWIVFPFLVTAYLALVHRLPLRTAFRRAATPWVAWLVYVVVFLVMPMISGAPSATHYAEFQILPALTKTSATVLGFCGLGWLPIDTWATAVAATVIVVGIATWLIRTGDGLGQWALLWVVATLALVAPFPLAVLRHNYLPIAGFWMLVASVVDRSLVGASSSATGQGRRRLMLGLVSSATIAVLAVEVWALQREIADYRLYGELHRRLCQSYAEIEGEIPRERPLILVDRGALRGVEYVADRVQGCDKTFFVRRDALWQLVFLPPLANFMGEPFDERLEGVETEEAVLAPGAFSVLLFEDSGFSLRPDLRDAIVEAFKESGNLPPGVSLYQFIAE
jgi:hypothetical protein